jgi:hypothetical protein
VNGASGTDRDEEDAKGLGDLDLQLYLAGAMPLAKRLLMALSLMADGDLRARMRAVRAANATYRETEMGRLASRLYPESGISKAETPIDTSKSRTFKVTHPRVARWDLRLAGSLALLALCALPFWHTAAPGPEDAIAKGRGLGVNLFVKGDTAYRVENQDARISPADTLQVVPLGSEPQHLVLLGWDARQGLVRLFPQNGAYSHRVSHDEPPPALLLQGLSDNRLICVTATSPFRVSDVEALLRRTPYHSAGPAPASRLEGGMYLQIFTISKRDGRI